MQKSTALSTVSGGTGSGCFRYRQKVGLSDRGDDALSAGDEPVFVSVGRMRGKRKEREKKGLLAYLIRALKSAKDAGPQGPLPTDLATRKPAEGLVGSWLPRTDDVYQ